ncbi:MAG: D-Ala-D-Ala carboxypeptidase family metallohydrolase [Verrucomicrobiota bacterium]
MKNIEPADQALETRFFFTRRGSLKVGLLGSAGLFLPHSAQAFFFQSHPEVRLPDTWKKRLGSRGQQYANFLGSLKLKNVTPYQVLYPHLKTRGKVANSVPPKRLWKNIRETLQVTDKLAGILRLPVKEVVSAYRSPRYNSACRGKSRSLHMENKALDLKFDCSSWRVAKAARLMREKGHFEGGVGYYRNFVHVDTRGSNVDW